MLLFMKKFIFFLKIFTVFRKNFHKYGFFMKILLKNGEPYCKRGAVYGIIYKNKCQISARKDKQIS